MEKGFLSLEPRRRATGFRSCQCEAKCIALIKIKASPHESSICIRSKGDLGCSRRTQRKKKSDAANIAVAQSGWCNPEKRDKCKSKPCAGCRSTKIYHDYFIGSHSTCIELRAFAYAAVPSWRMKTITGKLRIRLE